MDVKDTADVVDMSEIMVGLGRRVSGKRHERGWTQAELARRAGCSSTTISNLETAKLVKFSIGNLLGIARALGVSIDYLMDYEPSGDKRVRADK